MFITFEGIEGSGKSTAARILAEYMQERGMDLLLTKEPGGCPLGRGLRHTLLDARAHAVCSRAELFLFLADRAQHVAEVIRPALESGQCVLCDRYVDSTLAYQGYGRGLDTEFLRRLNETATGGLSPDLTLLLDVPVPCGIMRAGQRNKEAGTTVSEGRFDSESRAFHERVQKGYRVLAQEEPERFAVIDASQPVEDVSLQCLSAVEKILRLRGEDL
ncbi:MAG: dTMP kinase [Desulfovibrio sp.]|jgi:dTMP kinase|nr:dTMP kinase [Desulfovibrio sp.]